MKCSSADFQIERLQDHTALACPIFLQREYQFLERAWRVGLRAGGRGVSFVVFSGHMVSKYIHSNMPPHLLAAISFHGYGHLAQSGPVISALRLRIPNLRVTLQCAAPREVIDHFVNGAYELLPDPVDIGMVNVDALRVDVKKSAAAYRTFHADWEQRVSGAATQMKNLKPSVVLGNIPYLPLLGAHEAGIPSVALCSLNWADIYAHYLGQQSEAPRVLAQMRRGYQSARTVLLPEPSMPMADLRNTRRIGTVARVGIEQRAKLRHALRVPDDARLVLVALGGITTDVDVTQWPHLENAYWLVQSGWKINHPAARAWDELGWRFIDVLRSSDVLITKPGYGSFAEAACNGVPVLYVRRGDWPEEEYLVNWLQRVTRCQALSRAQFTTGAIATEVESMLARARPSALEPRGIADAVSELLQYF